MTLRELNQLRHLKNEIAADYRRLRELEQMAASPSSPNLDGLPIRGGNRIENYVAEIYDLQQVIEQKIRHLLKEQTRIEQYISSISDSYLRQIFEYRFVDGLSWNSVAQALGGTTADAARMAVVRYLDAGETKTAEK